jgi:acyl carrier protein
VQVNPKEGRNPKSEVVEPGAGSRISDFGFHSDFGFRASGLPALPGNELREFAQARLPEFMVPSAFVVLDALPLTENGKVDRRVLPSPEGVESTFNETCAAPRNRTEEALLEIWSQVLGRQSVGIHDNFFQLGGHSLLATQLVSRIGSGLGIELPVRAIFEAPTIAALAEVADRVPPKSATVSPAIRPEMDGAQAEALLARVEQLSDAEVEELLTHSFPIQP